MKHRLLLLVTILLTGLAAHSQRASKQRDSIGRNMTPPEGMALVYVIRPTNFGSAITMNVSCDMASIGTTSAKSYLYTLVPAGKHTIRSKAENMSELELDAEPGKIYYIEQAVKMGIVYARARLNLVTEEAGKKFLAKCKLEESNIHDEKVN